MEVKLPASALQQFFDDAHCVALEIDAGDRGETGEVSVPWDKITAEMAFDPAA